MRKFTNRGRGPLHNRFFWINLSNGAICWSINAEPSDKHVKSGQLHQIGYYTRRGSNWMLSPRVTCWHETNSQSNHCWQERLRPCQQTPVCVLTAHTQQARRKLTAVRYAQFYVHLQNFARCCMLWGWLPPLGGWSTVSSCDGHRECCSGRFVNEYFNWLFSFVICNCDLSWLQLYKSKTWTHLVFFYTHKFWMFRALQ